MQKLHVAVLLIASHAIAASDLSGTVTDESKTPLDGVRIVAWQASTRKPFETVSVNGRFSLSGLPAGDFVLSVDQPGQALTLAAVRIGKNKDHELGFVLAPGRDLVRSLPPVRAPAAAGPTPTGPGKVTQARLIQKATPVIPPSFRQFSLPGKVLIEVEIETDGRVNDLVVLSAPHVDMAFSSLLAVIQWRYSPTRIDGVAVPVVTTIDVNFEK